MPTIAISSGDPAGIGLEVILKALSPLLESAQWVLFTDSYAFDRNYALFGDRLPYRWIEDFQDAAADNGLFLVHVAGADAAIPWGERRADAGRRATAYLEAASRAALRGDVDAVVTGPVSKASVGPDFKGQTEFLAELAQADTFAMSFFTPTFHVVLATIHVALKEALARISTPHYIGLIRFVDREFGRLGMTHPRIAVAAVNPHAGEGGMFGREEIDILAPAVEECANGGIRVSGPHSADSLYHRAHTGEFDVIIAPYHDQGLIPVKLIAPGESTNVTLGLPYIRTSPDHGTAFRIAGRGVADPAGMQAALRCALALTRRKSPS